MSLLVVKTNNEYRITPEADTYQTPINLLAHIAMQAQCISRRLEIDDCCLRLHVWKKGPKEVRDVAWEFRWLLWRIELVGPVILATQSHPPDFLLQSRLCSNRLVNCHVYWLMGYLIRGLREE